MRFKEVIHPEIVHDKRGTERTRRLYREMLDIFIIKDGQPYYQPTTEYQSKHLDFFKDDHVFMEHLELCKIFKKENGKVYRIGKEIGIAFSKINKDIPLDILPKKFIGFLSFHPETIYDEDGWCTGAYVFLGYHGDCGAMSNSLTDEQKKTQLLWITYMSTNTTTHDEIGQITKLMVPMSSDIMNLVGGHGYSSCDVDIFSGEKTKITDETRQKRAVVYSAIINSLIYIFSEEPTLELARPVKQTGLSNNEILRRGHVINECTLPVTFVYRDFHGMQYTVDKTQVSGHRRWQRCGPQNSKVKLIWIDPHQRVYQKKENANVSETNSAST